MKLILSLAVLFFFSPAGRGAGSPALIDMSSGAPNPAPGELKLAEYLAWAEPLLRAHDSLSAFTPKLFAWYEAERDAPLPGEVAADPQRIHVNVRRPLEETIALEAAGEITEGNTVGAELYAEQEGSLHEALETMLFRWGRPTGSDGGSTQPPAGPFRRRSEYFAANPEWGPGAFATLSLRRDGGIVKDLADRYLLLVRGDGEKGYDVLMQFVKPAGPTQTEKCLAIAILRPLGEGRISYKISTRYQGQNYRILGGLKFGREQIGFHAGKVRSVQLEANALLRELRESGRIADRPSGIDRSFFLFPN